MGRIEDDALPEGERVYAAVTLREARRIEETLTGHGIEYAVEVEELGRTPIFGSVRHGAVFYVRASQASFCRTLLAAIGKGVI